MKDELNELYMPASQPGYRSMDNPGGSEERIGQGLGGPQNPNGPRYSRRPNIYGN
jgi:hypothetical protein